MVWFKQLNTVLLLSAVQFPSWLRLETENRWENHFNPRLYCKGCNYRKTFLGTPVRHVGKSFWASYLKKNVMEGVREGRGLGPRAANSATAIGVQGRGSSQRPHHPSPIRQKTSVGFYSCRRRVRGGVGGDSALISQERAARVKTTPVRRASDSADRFTKKRSEQGARLFTRNPLASFLVGGGKNKTWIAQHPEAVITHASARVAACVIWHIHTDLHVYTLLSLLINPYTWRVFVFFAQSAGHTLTLMSGRTCSMCEAVDFTTP